jgi:hypothetical protein
VLGETPHLILLCTEPSGAATMSSGRGWLARRGIRWQEAGRTEITSSREGAKPRRFDEKRIIFIRVLGPRWWSRPQAKAIWATAAVRQAGSHTGVQARVRGQGGRSTPRNQSWLCLDEVNYSMS